MTKPLKQRIVRQPLGRPSSYRTEYAAQLIEYFEQPAYDRVEMVWDEEQKKEVPKQIYGVFPTLARFSTMVGVTQETLREWADKKDIDDVTPLYPEFSAAYYKVRAYQEAYLTEGYASGAYSNPGFGALIAKNILAWKDKTEQEVSSTVNANVKADVSVAVSGLASRLEFLEGKKDSSDH